MGYSWTGEIQDDYADILQGRNGDLACIRLHRGDNIQQYLKLAEINRPARASKCKKSANREQDRFARKPEENRFAEGLSVS